jgi:hypothetical protein
MAKGIQNFTNVDTTNPTDYPNGSIKDAPNGVGMNRTTFDDIFQFFSKLCRFNSIAPNNTPDNEANGFQYVEALRATSCSKLVKTFISGLDGDVVTITRAEIIAAFGNTGDFSKGVGDAANLLVDFHISVAVQLTDPLTDWSYHTPDTSTNSGVPVTVDRTTGDIDISLDLQPSDDANVRVTIIG